MVCMLPICCYEAFYVIICLHATLIVMNAKMVSKVLECTLGGTESTFETLGTVPLGYKRELITLLLTDFKLHPLFIHFPSFIASHLRR